MLGTAFAGLAERMSAAVGAPFHDAVARWPGVPVFDSGGSITTPGTSTTLAVKAQVDNATDSMRRDAQFVEGDVRLLILSTAIDVNCRVEVMGGPYAGTWSIESVSRDPAGIGTECRGRKWA
jgi:hypothetical protein